MNKLAKYILVKENGDEVLVPMVTVDEDEKPTRKGKGKKKAKKPPADKAIPQNGLQLCVSFIFI